MEKVNGRKIGEVELRGLKKGTIPVFDEFGPYNHLGVAVVKKNGKYGLVNHIPEIVIPLTADSIEFVTDRILLIRRKDFYYLYTYRGYRAAEISFWSKEEAERYALLLTY